MAEKAAIQVRDNCPEGVAYQLLQDIASVERKSLHGGDLEIYWTRAGRKWILDTYAECILAVRMPTKRT